jgi:hypothetical protein
MEALGFDPTPLTTAPWAAASVVSLLSLAVAVWLITSALVFGIGAFRYLILFLLGKEQ